MTTLRVNEVPIAVPEYREFLPVYHAPRGAWHTTAPTFWWATPACPIPDSNQVASAAFYDSWGDEWGDDTDYA